MCTYFSYFSHNFLLIQIVDTFGGDPTTLSEFDFPIAMAHAVHRQVGILEMFFSTHFRPVDAHCIHVDPKSTAEVRSAVDGIVRCYKERFPETNIFVAKAPVPVFWCHGSLLEADLICLRELLKVQYDERLS